MLNTFTTIQTMLNNTITYQGATIPCYYEHFTTADIKIPCISFSLQNDRKDVSGNTLHFSDLSINVSVWAMELEDMQAIATLVDNKCRANGMSRNQTNDLILETGIIKRVMTYNAKAWEVINNE